MLVKHYRPRQTRCYYWALSQTLDRCTFIYFTCFLHFLNTMSSVFLFVFPLPSFAFLLVFIITIIITSFSHMTASH